MSRKGNPLLVDSAMVDSPESASRGRTLAISRPRIALVACFALAALCGCFPGGAVDEARDLTNQGKPQEALKILVREMRMTRDTQRLHLETARALDQLGRRDESLAHAKEALRVDPEYGDAWALYGGILEKAGRHDESQQALEKAKRYAGKSGHAVQDHATVASWLSRLHVLRFR